MEKMITYFGQKAKVVCDEKCNKAWGTNRRPKINLDPNDEDYFAYLSDDELGEAPENPGTYEGRDAKPTNKHEIGNRWCVRECERCSMSSPGEHNQSLKLKDFSTRVYNRGSKF